MMTYIYRLVILILYSYYVHSKYNECISDRELSPSFTELRNYIYEYYTDTVLDIPINGGINVLNINLSIIDQVLLSSL